MRPHFSDRITFRQPEFTQSTFRTAPPVGFQLQPNWSGRHGGNGSIRHRALRATGTRAFLKTAPFRCSLGPGRALLALRIVLAIILIIAAIAIPNLMRARMSANATYSNLGFTTSLPYLGGAGRCSVPSTGSGSFIDSSLPTGTKSGYKFTVAMEAIQWFQEIIVVSRCAGEHKRQSLSLIHI